MTQFLMKLGFLIMIMATNPRTGMLFGAIFFIAAVYPNANPWGIQDSSWSWAITLSWGFFPILLSGTSFTMAVLVIGCIMGFIHARIDIERRTEQRKCSMRTGKWQS